MRQLAGILLALALLAVAVVFAAVNMGERVTVDLGVVELYRIPLTLVIFGSLFLGMLVMVVVGIDSDLKVRRILRERLRQEDLEERSRTDRYQRDLFTEDEEAG